MATDAIDDTLEFPRIPQPGSAWEHGVDARLGALEATALRTEATATRTEDKVDRIVPKLVEELTKPPFMERCGKWGLEFLTLCVTRLTDPAVIKYTAVVSIVALVLILGGTFVGWGVTVGAAP